MHGAADAYESGESVNESVKKTEYDLINFTGKIHLITTDSELSGIAGELNSAKHLGFDTETRPSFKKGDFFDVSLLQLSTDHNAYLIRLAKVTQFQVLKTIFENKEIVKVGVAIRDDIKHLQKRFSFSPLNFVELQEVAKLKGLKNFGLKGMTEEVLQARLSKKAKITNWDAHTLTEQQILYAATDAWIGLQIFQKINQADEKCP